MKGNECDHGHLMTPENTVMRSEGDGRACRECRRAAWRRAADRLKAWHTGVITTEDARSVPLDYFWAQVQRRNDGCWVWTGRQSGDGYGQCRIPARRSATTAHRVAWALTGHELDPAKELDHLCRNRICVNPAHLELVPQYVNWTRGQTPSRLNALQTHCKRGHEFTPENTYLHKGRSRHCRACAVLRDRARRAEARAAKAAS